MFLIRRTAFSFQRLSSPWINPRLFATQHAPDEDHVVQVEGGKLLEREFNRQKKKQKLTPREKYMFKRMRTKFRQTTVGYLKDQVSDLKPVYDLLPENQNSPLTQQIASPTHQHPLSKRQEALALRISQTMEDAVRDLGRKKQRQKDEESVTDLQEKEDVVEEEKSGLDEGFLKTAAYVKQLQRKGVLGGFQSRREFFAEKIATRLHRRDLVSSHEYCKEDSIEKETEEDSEFNKALQKHPTFPRDAARLEAISKDLENVDDWIKEVSGFAKKHGEVIDAMDTYSALEDYELDSSLTSDSENVKDLNLGPLGHNLMKNMEASGINIESLQSTAKEEFEKEMKTIFRKDRSNS